MKRDSTMNAIDDNSCGNACCDHTQRGQNLADTVSPKQAVQKNNRPTVLFDITQLQPISSLGEDGTKTDAHQAGAKTIEVARGKKTVYRLSGLDCGDCAAKLEKRLSMIPGVASATVNFSTAKMTAVHECDDALIIQAIEQAGYGAERETSVFRQPAKPQQWWKNSRTIATMVSGVLLGCAVGSDWFGLHAEVVTIFYVLAMIFGGFHAARSGLYSLRSLSLDMNVLMTAAVTGAALLGEWHEGATVAFLFSFGNALQTYTMEKTRRSIQSLMDMAPAEALVRRGHEEQRLPVEEIMVGDILIVKPGERIALDGKVVHGSSAVNQAAITGESIPVEKTIGDSVFAGTINEHGALEIQATQLAADSTLAKIFHLVEEAQAQKAPSQQFVDIFARYYTPLVLIVAAGVMVLPPLFLQQPFAPWFYNGLVLLVISCPCALVISTPVSIVAAIGNASRHGVLIKGGAYLEEMGSITSIAFDKTGTLTLGRPKVTDIVVANGDSEIQVLSMAAGIERRSEHPLARAVVERAKGISLQPAEQFQALVGRGAQAVIAGRLMYIGNVRLFEELGHDLDPYKGRLSELEEQGKTVVLLGSQETILALFALADTLRDNSKETIRALHTSGMKHIAMLTGDNRRVAGAIARTLDLDAFYNDLLPEDKVAAIKKMQHDYGKVAMVGDGVNDAPALASATVGIAMGVAGSDAALETADIALMNDDLRKLAYIMRLSRKTVAIVKQNICFSILIKLVFILLLVFNMATLWLAVFADMGASLLVTLNGMRLMRRLPNKESVLRATR